MLRWMAVILLTGCLAEGTQPVGPTPDMTLPDMPEPDMEVPDMPEDVDLPDPIEYGGPCDPFLQDCEHGKCVPDPRDGLSTCVAELTNKGLGESCSSISQCMSGTYCATLAGSNALCWEMCDITAVEAGAPDPCSTGTACVARITSIPGLGLCAGVPAACDIYTQDCDAGDCVVMRHPTNGEIGTFCGRAGNLKEGEACDVKPADCASGLICVELGSSATCQKVCTLNTDCSTNACTGLTTTTNLRFCQ